LFVLLAENRFHRARPLPPERGLRQNEYDPRVPINRTDHLLFYKKKPHTRAGVSHSESAWVA